MNPKKLTPSQKREQKAYKRGKLDGEQDMLHFITQIASLRGEVKMLQEQKTDLIHTRDTLIAKNKSLIALLQSIHTISQAGATINGV